jgi:hypothetical protein
MSTVQPTLFDRWKSRPLPDPNRPKPVRDAIKNALMELVKQGGGMLLPMLLQLAQKYIGGLAAPADAESSALLADTKAFIDEQAAKHAYSVESFDADDLAWLQTWLLSLFTHFGPDVLGWIVELLSPKSEAPAAAP